MGYIFTLPGSAVFSEGQSLVEQSGELARPESDVAGGESRASYKGEDLQSSKTRAKSKVSITSLEENLSPD